MAIMVHQSLLEQGHIQDLPVAVMILLSNETQFVVPSYRTSQFPIAANFKVLVPRNGGPLKCDLHLRDSRPDRQCMSSSHTQGHGAITSGYWSHSDRGAAIFAVQDPITDQLDPFSLKVYGSLESTCS
jgi:hypothetical protein